MTFEAIKWQKADPARLKRGVVLELDYWSKCMDVLQDDNARTFCGFEELRLAQKELRMSWHWFEAYFD